MKRLLWLLLAVLVAMPFALAQTHSGGGGGSGGGSGTVTSATVVGTTNQITVTGVGLCASTTVLNCKLSLPNGVDLGTDNSAAGTLQLSNGSANAHTIFGSAATTSNTIKGFATVPTNGDVVGCMVSGTVCTLFDAGAPGANTALSNLAAGAVNPNSYIVPIVTSGLMAEYLMFPSETPSALVDYSSNGNTATGTVGSAPTIISNTGGIACSANGAVSLPAGLNSAETVIVYMTANINAGSQTVFQSPIGGNGNGTQTGAIQLILTNATFGNFTPSAMPFPNQGSYKVFIASPTVTLAEGTWNGTGDLAMVLGPSTDLLYFNGSLFSPASASWVTSGTSEGNQTVGNYQICGAQKQYGNPVNASTGTYFSGNVYAVLFYSGQLTAQQIAQDHQALSNMMAARGVPVAVPAATTDYTNIAFLGDSITNGDSGQSGAFTSYPSILATTNHLTSTAGSSFDFTNLGVNGAMSNYISSAAPVFIPPHSNSQVPYGVVMLWDGTNNHCSTAALCAAVAANQAQTCSIAHTSGMKCIVAPMLSRTGGYDTYKDILNPLMYRIWRTYADGIFDPASNPNLGADGAYSNTTYFNADAIHPTTASSYNIITPIAQRSINALYGNTSWTSAATYTSGPAAATNCSSASETAQVITFTGCTGFTATVGTMVTTAGWTPSGYNSTNIGFYVLSSSSGTFTVEGWTTGLGASSGAGTANQAYDQQDVDVFTILGGSSGSQSFRLETCQGITGQSRYYQNTDTNSWTLTPFSSETIGGAASYVLQPGATVAMQSTLVSAAASGCNWSISF